MKASNPDNVKIAIKYIIDLLVTLMTSKLKIVKLGTTLCISNETLIFMFKVQIV